MTKAWETIGNTIFGVAMVYIFAVYVYAFAATVFVTF